MSDIARERDIPGMAYTLVGMRGACITTESHILVFETNFTNTLLLNHRAQTWLQVKDAGVSRILWGYARGESQQLRQIPEGIIIHLRNLCSWFGQSTLRWIVDGPQ